MLRHHVICELIELHRQHIRYYNPLYSRRGDSNVVIASYRATVKAM